ncbi:hypothetical protein QTG54_006937 [Skeletonema marinoi]|uniref:Uncharacterized protein n=1 Tax=Skeletonema marinoi TaxID=267567 RepID=A0AAD8YBG3_9STRA|nr:hypothetical protein QTG54_006937 [Skeletonema marinoi]
MLWIAIFTALDTNANNLAIPIGSLFLLLSYYLPLVGKLGDDVKGDGIVPTELAFMESPARRVEIEKCSLSGSAVRHAHVLPTPWNLLDGNAASIKLPEDIVWYGSPGVLSQWLGYIE